MKVPDMHFDAHVKKTVIAAGALDNNFEEVLVHHVIGLLYMDDGSFTIDISKFISDEKGYELIKSIKNIPDLKHAISIFEEIQMQFFKEVITKPEEYKE